VTLPALSILSWRTRSWLSVVRSLLGLAFGRVAYAVAGVALEPFDFALGQAR
jgi:hypothetical protein